MREGNSNRRCRISNFIAHTPPHIFFSFNESANAPHKNTRNNADFAAAQAEEAALKAAEDKKRKRTGGELSPFFFWCFSSSPQYQALVFKRCFLCAPSALKIRGAFSPPPSSTTIAAGTKPKKKMAANPSSRGRTGGTSRTSVTHSHACLETQGYCRDCHPLPRTREGEASMQCPRESVVSCLLMC